MNKPTAIIYSTTDGHTRHICGVLQDHLQKSNHFVSLHAIEEFHKAPADFNSLIIGASVRYGRHSLMIQQFVRNNRQALAKVKTAFFSVNLVARKEGKNRAHNNPYLVKFLNEMKWQPDIADVFAGKLDYRRYSFWDRIMIKLIMKLTNGPTRTGEPVIYTSWERVKQFSDRLITAGFFGENASSLTENHSMFISPR
jgi:menaquinone-dependent protoporphyrinogen oxidase